MNKQCLKALLVHIRELTYMCGLTLLLNLDIGLLNSVSVITEWPTFRSKAILPFLSMMYWVLRYEQIMLRSIICSYQSTHLYLSTHFTFKPGFRAFKSISMTTEWPIFRSKAILPLLSMMYWVLRYEQIMLRSIICSYLSTLSRFSHTCSLAVFTPKTLFQTLKSKGQGSWVMHIWSIQDNIYLSMDSHSYIFLVWKARIINILGIVLTSLKQQTPES